MGGNTRLKGGMRGDTRLKGGMEQMDFLKQIMTVIFRFLSEPRLPPTLSQVPEMEVRRSAFLPCG